MLSDLPLIIKQVSQNIDTAFDSKAQGIHSFLILLRNIYMSFLLSHLFSSMLSCVLVFSINCLFSVEGIWENAVNFHVQNMLSFFF